MQLTWVAVKLWHAAPGCHRAHKRHDHWRGVRHGRLVAAAVSAGAPTAALLFDPTRLMHFLHVITWCACLLPC